MTTAVALVTGLATSLHCVGMCGPIACGLGSMAKSDTERLTAATAYHGSRLFSYALIGALCGALGQQPLKWFFDSPAVLLPWVMVLMLFAVAFGLDQRIPRPAFLARFTTRARFKMHRFSAVGSSTAMGILTPLLPCGPLYIIFGAALLAGSAAQGAEFMLAFGLGTIPLLWLAQSQFHRLRAKLTPKSMKWMRRGLALVTAVVLAWRLQGTLPSNAPSVHDQEPNHDLPSCCH